MNGPKAIALAAAFEEFEADKTSRVAILTGTDGTFCAGADLKGVAEGRGNRVTQDGNGPMGPTRMLLSKPVIAAIEGYAVAGGLELAMWCDLRVAAEDAEFGVFCRRWGVPLMDGGTIRLSRRLGHSHATDMSLTVRSVRGEEDRLMGLANRLVKKGTALSQEKNLANELCQFPQLCLRSDRLSSYQQWDLTLDNAFRNETELGLQVIQSGETRQGAQRFADGAGRHGQFGKDTA